MSNSYVAYYIHILYIYDVMVLIHDGGKLIKINKYR